MRIYGVLFAVGMLSGAMAIRAQVEQPALQGLSQYGVTLTGTLENPVLVQTRKSKGETAADQLAEIYSSLPTLWK